MELGVPAHLFGNVGRTRLRGYLGPVEIRMQQFQVIWRKVTHSHLYRKKDQCVQHQQKLGCVPVGPRTNVGRPGRITLDHFKLLQLVDRIPNGGAADGEPFGDIPLDQARGLSTWHAAGRSVPLNVSAGLGHSIYAPVRFGCRPEASVITLRAADSLRAPVTG